MSILLQTLYKIQNPELAPALEAECRQLRRSMGRDKHGALKPSLLINHGWFDANSPDKKAIDPRSHLEKTYETVEECEAEYNFYIQRWIEDGYVHSFAKDVFAGEVYEYLGV